MITTFYVLSCDNWRKCGREYGNAGMEEMHDRDRLRAGARIDGWRTKERVNGRLRGKDLCPDCRAGGAS